METKCRKIGGALYILIPQKESKRRNISPGNVEIFFKEDKRYSDLEEIKELIKSSKTDEDYIADKIAGILNKGLRGG